MILSYQRDSWDKGVNVLIKNTILPVNTFYICFSQDWEYAMRREMQEIVPNLYLGPYASANKNKVQIQLLSTKGNSQIENYI
jgi:hypothetical protein